MYTIVSETDEGICRDLWERLIPQETISDLWGVRNCFHKHYRNDLFFVLAKEGESIVGFLPLSRMAGEEAYGFFPGEVWKGHTWIEQNRVIAKNNDVLRAMLFWLHEQGLRFHLRYLLDNPCFDPETAVVDEIGYLFYPKESSFDIDNYFSKFTSRKSLKSIRKEIRSFEERGLEYRLNHEPDFDLMVQMNCDRFAESSYFSNETFRNSFKDMMLYFRDQGWLRIVTILVDGKIAAVDTGCVYNNAYILLAGGTNADFMGIAKVINLYHMKKACEERFDSADFLCGDFSWKKIFHLTPRPLYLISNWGEQQSPLFTNSEVKNA